MQAVIIGLALLIFGFFADAVYDRINQPEPTILPQSQKRIVLPTPTPTLQPKPEVKSQQIVVNPTPTPTPDPDPIVICKSKTGDIQVRHSVCKSYTDCPDGYGGYVFESQEACKKDGKGLEKNLLRV